MPREIKFRGLSRLSIDEMDECGIKHVNGWVFGAYLDAYILNDVMEATYEYIAIEQWCPVDPDTVGQFTGLRDKNGTEIYEGDIYRFYSPAWDKMLVEVIGWPFDGTMLECEGEVIGNIHENPELVGETNES